MPSNRDYINLIQDHLNETTRSKTIPEGLAYQLGFLQGFLAQQMIEKPELIFEFRRQVRATLKRQGQ
jgi:UDP-glucose 4-epimerase